MGEFSFYGTEKIVRERRKNGHVQFLEELCGAEVDYIEKMTNKDMKAFEFKYGNGSLQRGAASFTKEYHTDVQLINQQNYLDFLRQE